MSSFYIKNIKSFLEEEEKSILSDLAAGITNLNFELNEETLNSWKDAIAQLRPCLRSIVSKNPVAADWSILLEYVIPMINQRIDCVIIAGDLILVIEFKGGESTSGAQALRQAQEYALNLSDFHEESRHRVIFPLALGTFKTLKTLDTTNAGKGAIITHVQLEETLKVSIETWGNKANAIDPARWDKSRYFPVPTIIDAASNIYANHDVKDLANSKAGVENLKETETCIVNAVNEARVRGAKKLIILTGVPGAGKTLAGLNAVQTVQSKLEASKEQASFLSGNSPLVEVLQEALKRSVRRTGKKSTRSIRSRIRNMHTFVNETYADTENRPPAERLIVFDEAQRAWTAAKNKKKFGRDISEPDMVLDIMARHQGWAVIIALVGGGQEIHGGEAGLAAWGDAIVNHPEWEVLTSPEALHGGPSVAGSRLFRSEVSIPLKIKDAKDLHLAISKRSIESEVTAAWVNATLMGEVTKAAELSKKGLSIWVTRDLAKARNWLKYHSEGNRRAGLIASSGADRLRAEGVETPTFTFLGGIDYKRWFLDDRFDHRSSNQLEVALSEFEMQGLEIDVSGLLWGCDLIFKNGKPVPRKLKGCTWEKISGNGDPQAGADDNSMRTINKYRVLLTRFRKAMVIFVPKGDHEDQTRAPDDFDSAYLHLKSCGLRDLPAQ
jgi:hypothetical protein